MATSDDPSDRLVVRLRSAGCVFAEEEAAVLRAAAAEDASPEDALERMTAARVAGRPLEQVVGWAEVDGVRVLVEPGVFVPRRRSLLLVRLAAERVARGGVVVDLCCGTGALGLMVARARPDVDLHAADVDPAAVLAAHRNLEPIGGSVHAGDLFSALPGALRGGVSALVVNAPYVPTEAVATMPPEARDHEHRVALDGGSDGLDVQRRVADGVAEWLAPGGCVVVETSVAQAERSAGLLADAGLVVESHRDEDLDGTAVLGVLGP